MSSKGGQFTSEEHWQRNRQTDAFRQRWITRREPDQGRKLAAVWAAMLAATMGKGKAKVAAGDRKNRYPGFTTKSVAASTGSSPRYVRSYILALVRAGYLDTLKPHQSPHSPAIYKVNDAYRGEIAPQLAGGSGGGGRLGNGWKAAADRAPIAKKEMPATKRKARK